MGWRESLREHSARRDLCGLTLGQWLRLLADNRFAVDPPYWLRGGTSLGRNAKTACSAGGSGCGTKRRSGPPTPSPLFVLGIWRSGTTHLHNLLARDERFAFPNQSRFSIRTRS